MKLFLNELSLYPLAINKFDAIKRMAFFAKAICEARKVGFRNIQTDYFTNQIPLTVEYSLFEWLNDSNVHKELRDFLFGVIKPPYIEEDDSDFLEQYLESDFTFKDDEYKFPQKSCIGLASAYLYNYPSISFLSLPVWRKVCLDITFKKEKQYYIQRVYNISSCETFRDINFKEFIELISEIRLIDSNINPNDKKVTLFGDHHGKKELNSLCKRLIKNPYVIEIRSTDYSRGRTKFIEKIQRDGVIVISLTYTKIRYALWVQTSGRNFKETKKIAEMIRDEFD